MVHLSLAVSVKTLNVNGLYTLKRQQLSNSIEKQNQGKSVIRVIYGIS